MPDEAAVHRLVPRAATGDEGHLPLHRGIRSIDVVGAEVHLDQVGVGGGHPLERLGDDVFGLVDQLLHAWLTPFRSEDPVNLSRTSRLPVPGATNAW